MLEVDEKVEIFLLYCKCLKYYYKYKKYWFYIFVEFLYCDVEELNVIFNVEYLEVEFFLYVGYGFGFNEFNGIFVNVIGFLFIGV